MAINDFFAGSAVVESTRLLGCAQSSGALQTSGAQVRDLRNPAPRTALLGREQLVGGGTPPQFDVLGEEAHQLGRRVRAKRVDVRTRRTAARPGVPEPVHGPLFDE